MCRIYQENGQQGRDGAREKERLDAGAANHITDTVPDRARWDMTEMSPIIPLIVANVKESIGDQSLYEESPLFAANPDGTAEDATG